MPKVNPLTFDQVNEMLAYGPDTGALTWKISPAKRIKAGARAGSFKGTRSNKKTGAETRYAYVRILYFETPAARVAWLLSHGVWPEGNIGFIDGNSENLRLSNLQEAQTQHTTVGKDGLKMRKLNRDVERNYALRRYYGLSLAEYGEKLLAQNGVCAICHEPETAKLHGKVKPLSVDHSHADGKIRDLLCSHCNHMLGHAHESRDALLAAVRYLDKHSDAQNVVALAPKEVAE